MYEDIKAGITEGDFSPTAIMEFFEATSGIMFFDCKDCGSGGMDVEIGRVATAASNGARAVRNVAVSHDYDKFKKTSIMETEKILKSLHEISNATLAYVDKYSFNSFFRRNEVLKSLFPIINSILRSL